MNLSLHAIPVSEALTHESWIDRAVAESSDALGLDVPAAGTARRMLEAHAERRETLVLVARHVESAETTAPVAVGVSIPFEDPVTEQCVPMIAALYVEPALRNRGVARALVREMRRLLAGRDTASLAARVGHNDDALISMGERWGFVRLWEWVQHA